MGNQVPGAKDTTVGRQGPVVDLVGFHRRLFPKVATTIPPLARHMPLVHPGGVHASGP